MADARALARAYEELAYKDGLAAPVPCTSLLLEIASRLVLLFGEVRAISTAMTAQRLMLETERRRALVLICSELVINALKYGFPHDRGGIIAIRLNVADGAATLVVEDDGNGDVDCHIPGRGSDLLDDLADVLGATVTRTCGSRGSGYRVSVTFPAAAALHER